MTSTITVNPVNMTTIVVNGAPGGGEIDTNDDYEWGGIHTHTFESSSIWQTLDSDANTTIVNDTITLIDGAGDQLKLTPTIITIGEILLTEAIFEEIIDESNLRESADVLLQTTIDDEVQARSDADALLQLKSEKDAANGYAGLTAGGVLNDAIIPSGITRDAELVSTVNAAVALILGGLPPGTLDSLVELATAINNDPAFSTTITALVNAKVATDLYDAHTVLAATTDNNPVAVSIGEGTILGRLVGGNIAALSAANLKTILSLSASDISGLAAVATSGSASDLTTGTLPIARIASNAVTNAKLAQMATNTIKGNNTGSTADASDLTPYQVYQMLNVAVSLGNLGSAHTLTPSTGPKQYGTLNTSGAGVVFSWASGLTSGINYEIELELIQDGTGNRTVSSWPSGMKWHAGIVPVLSTAAGAIDLFVVGTRDGGTTSYGYMVGRGMA